MFNHSLFGPLGSLIPIFLDNHLTQLAQLSVATVNIPYLKYII